MKMMFFFIALISLVFAPGLISAQPDQRLKVIREIPVLSYHNIYHSPPKINSLYISLHQFETQIQTLQKKGYHSVLPGELELFYTNGTPLPEKPFIISFDDAHVEHYTLALPILEKYHFKAVFFVMTVCIDKKGFLSSSQIAGLSSKGHIIGVHTWDHPNISKMALAKWETQIIKPKRKLEAIIGKPVNCFAFPYGAWNEQVVKKLHESGFSTAFQLQGKLSNSYPLLTVRRMMVNGNTSPDLLLQQMNTIFKS